jgi:hypothetical protein
MESIKSNPLYLPISHPGKSSKLRPPSKVLVCDINPDMLEVGKQRAVERGYTSDGGNFPAKKYLFQIPPFLGL